ncbi:hypothetical protein AYI68_g6275, partial [Smittium mucronatum]
MRDQIISSEKTPFEKEYAAYQDWIKYKTSVPFARDFYFKKGSISEKNWMNVDKERDSQWYFDGDKISSAQSPDSNIAEESEVDDENDSGSVEKFELMPRTTEADKKN